MVIIKFFLVVNQSEESFTELQQVNQEIYQELVGLMSRDDINVALKNEDKHEKFLDVLQAYHVYFKTQNPDLGEKVLTAIQLITEANGNARLTSSEVSVFFIKIFLACDQWCIR